MNLLASDHTLLVMAWSLVHFLWEGACLGLLAWAGLWLLRKRDPRARYIFACSVLLLMAAAPVATMFWLRAGTSEVALSVAEGSLPNPDGWCQVEAMLSPWLPWILTTYFIGVLGLSLRLAGSWAWLQTFRWRGARLASLDWQLTARALSRRLGLRRVVRILESTRVQVPMAIGILKPVVLVPSAAFLGMDSEALEAILGHELAHVLRHDYLINLLQSLVETLLFYHPAVWWLSRQIRAERELCCDDLAVALCGDAVLYSKALARLEELRPEGVISPQLATAIGGGSLMKRIQRLIIPTLHPMVPSRAALFTTFAAAILTTAGLARAQQAPPPPPPAPEAPPLPSPDIRPVAEKRVIVMKDKAGDKNVTLHLKGKVQLKPETPELAELGDGAWLKLNVQEDGKDKAFEIRKENGKETRLYTVDGVETPLDLQTQEAIRKQLGSIHDKEGLPGQDNVFVWKGREGEGPANHFVFRSEDFKPFRADVFLPDMKELRKEIQKSLDKSMKEAQATRRLSAAEAKKVMEEARKASEAALESLRRSHKFEIPRSEELQALGEDGELVVPGPVIVGRHAQTLEPKQRIEIEQHRMLLDDRKAEMEQLKSEMAELKATIQQMKEQMNKNGEAGK